MKYLFHLLGFLAAIFICQWSFNHIHAWVGVGLMVATALIFINYLINQIKKTMKKTNMILIVAILSLAAASCGTRVEPNYQGVLMENYGKNGISDYTNQLGRVNDWSPGTKLYQVPLWEQRASWADNGEGNTVLHLEASDRTGFTATPSYSYKVIAKKAAELVFKNANIEGSGDAFMRKLEFNVLEPRIYDFAKDEARSYTTDTLMLRGGSLRFENSVKKKVEDVFRELGLELITFNLQTKVAEKAQDKIDQKNEVNQNISLLDNKIVEQRKKNELITLEAEYNKILSTGITPQLLQQQFIEKWDGKTALYGTMPINLFKTIP